MPEEKLPPRPQQQPAEPKQDESATLAARVRDLEAALVAQRAAMPMSLVPEHGAGPGMEVNETWSQAEQDQATRQEAAGIGPDQ